MTMRSNKQPGTTSVADNFNQIFQPGWTPAHLVMPATINDDQAIQSLAHRSGTRALSEGVIHGLKDIADPVERFGAMLAHAKAFGDMADKLGIPTPQALQAEENAARAQYQQQYGNRASATVGSDLGQLVASVPLLEGGEELGARALGSLASPAVDAGVQFLRGEANGGLIKQIGSNIVHGGLQGAAYGQLTHPGIEPAVVDGGVGAVMGGLAVPAEGLSRLAGEGLDRLSTLGHPETYAANKLVGALSADQVDPMLAAGRLNKLGPKASLLDLNAPAVTRMGERIVAKGGEGGSAIARMVDARAADARDRLLAAVTDSTGAKGGYAEAAKSLLAKRSAEAAPLYAKALAGDTASPYLDSLIADPAYKGLIKDGLTNLKTEADALRTGDVPATKMTQYHALKRGLDDAISTAKRTGANDAARAKTLLVHAVTDEMDKISPDYAVARANFAGHSQAMDALEAGKNVFKMAPDEIKDTLTTMKPGDKQMFRVGLAQAMRDRIDNVAEGRDASLAAMRTPAMANQLAEAFDSPEDFDRFQRVAQAEHQFALTRNATTKGSQTAGRMSDQDSDLLPHLGAIARGDHASGIVGLTRAGLSHMAGPDPNMTALGRLLASQDPRVIQNALTAPGPGLVRRSLGVVGKGLGYTALPFVVESANRAP